MKEYTTDSQLFARIFSLYKEPFISFANSYVNDRAVSEDIFIDSMINYWEKRHEFSEDLNIPAYLLTCIKNRALNHLRHLEAVNESEITLTDHYNRELKFRISSLESCEPEGLFSEEIMAIVECSLKKMPEQTAHIFKKSRFEYLSNKDIASEESLTIKAVEYHITKALKILRKELHDYLPFLLILLFFSFMIKLIK